MKRAHWAVFELEFATQEAVLVPGPLRAGLQCTGYLKIGGDGLAGADWYVSSARVGDVSADTVRLAVRTENLVKEV